MTEPDRSDDRRFGDLMRAAQDGDQRAYGRLLQDLSALLRRVVAARGSLVRPADVDDVVQEILLSVHAVRHTYDPARPFLPWLMAIARHRMLDASRRARRIAAREHSTDDPGVTFVEPATNPFQEPVGDAEALASALESLPPGQRQAITLLKLHDMSLQEAAAATGLSVGALKVATHRAIAALRKALVGD